MKPCLWIAGLALFGSLPNAETSLQSQCRQKWPDDVHMMMYCMREWRPAEAMSKRYPDYIQKECLKRGKSDYKMVYACLKTRDEYDDLRICDNRAKSSAEALPASWIKADCASWIRAQGKYCI